ncbi:MAG: hypothetical protein J6Y23_08525 [Prevotella sp.]|nr:hypothetical protein [Prevotella sp.]
MKKRILLTSILMAIVAIITLGCTKGKEAGNASGDTENKTSTKERVAVSEWDGENVPPVFAVCVKGQPLLAPFNEGDIIGNGKVLKQTPEKYTQFIMGEEAYGITYQEEKNKDLEHDSGYLNQYVYQSNDGMKGQLFSYTNPKAIEHYMTAHGETLPEGEFIPMEYTYGIIVGADYLKDRSIISFYSTTTEDPTEPQFSSDVIAKVEKTLGAKVEKNRVSHIIGDGEYQLGVMRTQPNDKYGIAAWVLAKGNDITIWTDTCEVVEEEQRVYWSNYDPDEYMEPGILAVVKGSNGLDIYCEHMSTDETVNYMLMRQKKSSFVKYDMGGFYQMYE